MGRVDFDDLRRDKRVLAGQTIPVVITPRIRTRGGGLGAIKSLIDGMGLTLDYLVHPSRVVTQQYPENRATLKFPERYRARLHLVHDADGYHQCTSCKMCERACPNGSIKVVTRPSGRPTPKFVLDRYVWRMDSCVFCNACIQACPFGALAMGHEFENAVYDRRLLVFTLNRYSGPPASTLLKEPDAAARQAMMEPCERYSGPVPMNGHPLPNLRPLNVPGVTGQPQGNAPLPGASASPAAPSLGEGGA